MRISSGILGVMLASFLAVSTSPVLFADDVLYNNLGSGSTYNANSMWTVSGAGSFLGEQYEPAFSFTPASTDYLTELEMALSYGSGTNSVTVELMTDSSGPGTLLESWTVDNLANWSDGSSTILQTLTSTGGVELLSGDTYWIAVLAGGTDTFAGWNMNSTGATGTAYENTGSGWVNEEEAVTGALEVMGNSGESPIPEPGTFVLLGSGLLGLAGALRRKYCC